MRFTLSLIGVLAACGPRLEPGAMDADGHTTSGGATPSTTRDSTTTDSSTTSVDRTSSSSTTGVDSLGFIAPSDAKTAILECSIWSEDCPAGEKCMPWSHDDEPTWNATRCSPIADEPVALGEPCTVEDSGVSGIDDCDLHSMCWDVDPETNEGTCVSFCTGSEESPICIDPGRDCRISNDGVLALCLPGCDPIAQDCPIGDGCFPDADLFWCLPDRQFPTTGDPCADFCSPGLACIDDDRVPNCMAEACCSELCRVGDPPSQCYLEGQICEPWFDPGTAPPGLDHVGVCAVPM
jgi:hypothetical protein